MTTPTLNSKIVKVLPHVQVAEGATVIGAPTDSVAELIAQMDEPTLRVFLDQYDIELDPIMTDFYNRMAKRAKTYHGLYFGLVTLLLMGDYTAAREVMLKADAGKLDPTDDRIRFLLINTNDIRNSGEPVTAEMLAEYGTLLDRVAFLVMHYDLHSGYFRRNTKSLKTEWDDLENLDNRICNGIDVAESMYRALFILLKFRLYIWAMMPKGDI